MSDDLQLDEKELMRLTYIILESIPDGVDVPTLIMSMGMATTVMFKTLAEDNRNQSLSLFSQYVHNMGNTMQEFFGDDVKFSSTAAREKETEH